MTQKLSTRQTYILDQISENRDIGVNELVRRLNVSRRTIQRDLNVLRGYLSAFGLELDVLPNAIRLIGSEVDLEKVVGPNSKMPTTPALTAKDRALYAVLELLLSDGPLKLSYLAKKLGVTSSSISYDLDLIVDWLRARKLILIRRPGYGIELSGDETARLETTAEIIHERSSDHLMSMLRGELVDGCTHPFDIWLKRWFIPDLVSEVRTVVSEELVDANPPLDDAAFSNFMLHVLLTCLRVRLREHMVQSEGETQFGREFTLCKRILNRLFPDELSMDTEAIYLAKHLRGAKVQMTEESKFLPPNITTMDLSYQISRVLEENLGIPLTEDRQFLLGLAQHLEPAIYRMKTGLSIRNPLLPEVKQRYPVYFEAMRNASNHVMEPHGLIVPEEEIGYLTMHVGAAVERWKSAIVWRVKIVCPNGISSAELLASRIRSEFPQIRVVSVNAADAVSDADCDLIVSTVPIHSRIRPLVTVTPFLNEDDVMHIENALHELEPSTTHVNDREAGQVSGNWDLTDLAKDISGRIQVHYVAPQNVTELIRLVAELVVEAGDADRTEPIVLALEARERIGSLVIPGKPLAVLHARAAPLRRCHVAIYRLVVPTTMQSVGQSVQEVDSVLVMLARIDEDPAVVKLLGKLSSALVMDPPFLDILRTAAAQEIHQSIFDTLHQLQE